MLSSKINKRFEVHDCARMCQGDILRDLSLYQVTGEELDEIRFPYLIIISQDCDLEQYYKKLNEVEKENNKSAEKNEETIVKKAPLQFLTNILLLPAFPSDILREGNHFTDLYNVKLDRINSANWDKIKDNKDERYHYLKGYQDYQVPDLVVDFKHYITLPFIDIKNKYCNVYLSTINELFREHLSQRFGNFISRIGTPEI